MADQWVDGEFVSGLIYAGASVRTNALFSAEKLGERPPGGRVILTCHERLEVPATYHLQARLQGEACYVVTYCYSIHSVEYKRMTLFRDQVLKESIWGRLFVKFYYMVSPTLIWLAARNYYTDCALRKSVAVLVRTLIPFGQCHHDSSR